MTRTMIHIMLLVFPMVSVGQQRSGDFHFRHYNTEHGLSNNSVYCFLEDSLGFLWVGTRHGLNRFDGYDFQVYDETNSGLEGSYISTLYNGPDQSIWVGTQAAGLYRYSWDRDDFIPFINIPGDTTSLSHNRVTSITGSSDGTIWVGTNGGGLNAIPKGSGKVAPVYLGPGCQRIKALLTDTRDNLWIGTFNGLYYFDRNTAAGQNLIGYTSENASSSEERILSLHLDVLGRLWVGTDGSGLFFVDDETKQLKRLPGDQPGLTESIIRKITSYPDGRIVLGTGNSGVLVVDPVTMEMQAILSDPDNEKSLTNNSVYDVIFDRFGSIWVANYSGGLNYYNPFDRKFSPVSHIRYKPNSLSNSNVRSFYQDREGRIWIGTRAGLNLALPNRSEFIAYDLALDTDDPGASSIVLSMLEDNQGRFWIGTYSGGIRLFNRNSGLVEQFRHPEDINHTLDQAHVYDLLEDTHRNIWIATLGGVYVMDPSGAHLSRYTLQNSNLCSNTVRVLMEDSRGNLWLGTGEGLNRYRPDKGTFDSFHFENQEDSEINKNHILCLFENGSNEIWVGTEGGGIKIMNPEGMITGAIGLGEGLPDNIINAIEKDDAGNFWISTNKGLCQYNANTGVVRVFTRDDGLQSNEFYPNSSLRTVDGMIYFGGHQGMNGFNPASIQINLHEPDLVFTRLFLKNQEATLLSVETPLTMPLPMTKRLVLSHRQRNISVHFAGLGFINPDKYQYSHYLEGFEENWNPFSKQRFATYTNLDRGTYTLRVKVRNNDQQESPRTASLQIIVLPPPWATWWAFMIYLTVITGLLLLFRYYIIAWTHVKNELKFEKREKEQIKEINQMKLRFFTNISHEFRTPLTLMRGYFEKLAAGVRDKNSVLALEQIDKNSRRLLNLVDELMDFRKAESGQLGLKASRGDLVKFTREIKEEFDELAKQHDIAYTFETYTPSVTVWFDPGKIEKVLFNLISNAFKFTQPSGMIQVMISTVVHRSGSSLKMSQGKSQGAGNWVEISVADSGIGISEKDLEHIFDRFFQVNEEEGRVQGTGIGLAFSKRLVEIHKGELHVESEPGRGSTFSVRLPLGSDHLNQDERFETERERFYLRIDYHSVLTEKFGPAVPADPGIETIPGKLRVLIIDDNLEILNLLKESLSEHYNLQFALDGKSGLEMVKEHHPDVLVTDLMMPGMTGIEVCNRVKCDPSSSHIPVIILTAKTDEEHHLEGLGSGADLYLTKPISAKLLIATIDNILANRQHLREKFAAMDTIAPSDLTRNKLDEDFLQRVINCVEENLSDPSLDVVSLSTLMGMSRSVLYRKIKALTGHSIQEFIRGIRLRRAKYLLIHTDKSISEVSFMVGFSNTKHFSTIFRREFDTSPSEFRK